MSTEQETPNPVKYPIGYTVGLWGAVVVLVNAVWPDTISGTVAGAVTALIPFVVVGIRAALGKKTAVSG